MQILQKAAAAPQLQSATLTDCVQQALHGSSSRIKISDIDAVIELLKDKRDQVEDEENTNKLHLLLAFLLESRSVYAHDR